jgi:hypothetical protein
MLSALAAIGLLASDAPLYRAGQSEVDSLRKLRREFPLNCRGGGGLVFDTISAPSEKPGAVTLYLTFVASQVASGPEGQGLLPGTCAWVDRPVTDDEPRRVRFINAFGDSVLQLTVRDSSQYWGFLAFDSDSGYLYSVGHRYWDSDSPPMPVARRASAPAPANRWLSFLRRYLLTGVLLWVLVAWGPLMVLMGLWSGWRRLAGLYPAQAVGQGSSFASGMMVMGLANYRGGVRLTSDRSYLHFSTTMMLRPGHPHFSVPWSEITLSSDEWPWFPLKGLRVIRISLARRRDLRILVPVRTGERLSADSQGRLAAPDAIEARTDEGVRSALGRW